MREFRPYGSVRGALSNGRPYRDHLPVVFGRRWVVPVLLDIGARYPDLSMEISLTDRRVDPVEEGIDLVIRIGDLDDSAALIARRFGI